MQEIFVFNEVAVIVRHWYEIGEDGREHGARVELRKLVPTPRRGTESAAQVITIDQPVWRADLFDLVEGQPGNFDRAHYHHRFNGPEPTARDWEEGLTADPLGWCIDQLSNLDRVIAAAHVELSNPDLECEEVREASERIMESVNRYIGSNCSSPDRCRAATRDAAPTIELMEKLYGGGVPAFEVA